MKKILLFLFLLFIPFFIFAQESTSSLLNELDATIMNKGDYEAKKIKKIEALTNQLSRATSDMQRADICGGLFYEYKNFQMDSALFYSNKRIELAILTKDTPLYITANMNRAEVMMVTGMYKEAFDILDSLEKKSNYTYDKQQKEYSYHLYHSLYMMMADYSFSGDERKYYKKLEYQYKDSILSALSTDNIGYSLVRSTQLLASGKYDEALQLATRCYNQFKGDEHSIAMTAYNLSEIYHLRGDRENEKKYLAISAINDVRSGVKEYIALRKLAILLYEDEDIDRAYNYMKSSMEDAMFCNARLRMLETSQMLPIINATYDIKTKAERNRLVVLLIVISVMACVLVGSTVYIYKQLKSLARARRLLKEVNADLKTMNENLSELNADLSESNLIKEEYISYVFNMCSVYIDKLEDYRKMINRKIKVGQIDDLLKITNSSSLVNDELKDFYKSFDTIFLSLYPSFIDEFNALLHDGEHIHPKEGELLSPELRIYALVRLGINDSVKIASFLHYSPQTVYNYRLKVRNKAIEKDEFAVAVLQIGRTKKQQ